MAQWNVECQEWIPCCVRSIGMIGVPGSVRSRSYLGMNMVHLSNTLGKQTGQYDIDRWFRSQYL